jgi:predicted transcriptional regulator
MKRSVNFNQDNFRERLIVIAKIDAGLKDIKEGRTFSHDAVKKRLKKWLK